MECGRCHFGWSAHLWFAARHAFTIAQTRYDGIMIKYAPPDEPEVIIRVNPSIVVTERIVPTKIVGEQPSTIRPKETDKQSDDQPQPLMWNSKDRIVCLHPYGCKEIPRTNYALILFLDVLSQHEGSGFLTNDDLAQEYDYYCERQRNRYKPAEKIPKYLRTPYQKLPSKHIGKMADRCINQLRDLFGIPPGRFFPIQNKGSLQHGEWTWHKMSPTKPAG